MTEEQLLMLLYPDELISIKKEVENLKIKSSDLNNFYVYFFNVFNDDFNNLAKIFVMNQLVKKDSYRSLVKKLLLNEVDKNINDINQSYIDEVLDNILLTIDNLIDYQLSMKKEKPEKVDEYIKIRKALEKM